MKKLFFAFAAGLLLLAGCAKEYDDTALKEKVDALDKKVTALQAEVDKLKGDVSGLSTVVEAWKNADVITKVDEIKEGDKVTGYTLTFKSGKTISLFNGKDGTNGTNGTSPVIGTKEEGGVLYWTVNGEFLLNGGKKVPVNVVPSFELKDGHLWVTIGGVAQDLGPVSEGSSVDGIIKSIVPGEKTVVFTLNGNPETVLEIPLAKPFGFVFEKNDYVVLSADPIVIAYTINGKTEKTDVGILKADLAAEIDAEKITVTPADATDKGEVVVWASNHIGQADIARLTFGPQEYANTDPAPEDPENKYDDDVNYIAEATEGAVAAHVTTNVDFTVKPEVDWITVGEITKASYTINFTIADNPQEAIRYGTVKIVLKSNEEVVLQTIKIAQAPGEKKFADGQWVLNTNNVDMQTHVNFTDDESMKGLTNYTYEIRFYANTFAKVSNGNSRRLANISNASEGNNLLLRFGDGNDNPGVLVVNGIINDVKTNFRFDALEWNTISITGDGTTARIYKNGEEIWSGANTGKLDATTFELGMSFRQGTPSYPDRQVFDGYIDYVRVWNVTRSAAEIKAGLCDVAKDAEGLKAYWVVDGKNKPAGVFADATGHGYDMDFSKTWRSGWTDNEPDVSALVASQWFDFTEPVCPPAPAPDPTYWEVDVLDMAFTGITSGTSYTAWSGKEGSASDAVYAGQSASYNGQCIQLRTNNNNSGIVSTTSGGKLKKIEIKFNQATSDRTIDIYGKNEAYTQATDLYNAATQGTKLGSIQAGTRNYVLYVEGDYQYVGLRSSNGSIYVNEFKISWEPEGVGPMPVEGKAPYMKQRMFGVTFPEAYAELDNVTMEGWIYPKSFSGAQANLPTFMGTENAFLVRFENSKPQIVLGDPVTGGGEIKASSNDALQTNAWYHIAAVYSRNDKVTLYVNGEQVAQNNSKDFPVTFNSGVKAGTNDDSEIGRIFWVGNAFSTRWFDGNMSRIRVWNKALTVDEIKASANNKALETEEGLIANWPLTEGTGVSVADKSGNSLNTVFKTNESKTVKEVEEVTWEDVTLPDLVTATGIALDQTSLEMTRGDQVTLKVSVTPANALVPKITWESSDNAIATVSGGLVTAKGVGSATITAKATVGEEEIKAECAVTVAGLTGAVAPYMKENYIRTSGFGNLNNVTVEWKMKAKSFDAPTVSTIFGREGQWLLRIGDEGIGLNELQLATNNTNDKDTKNWTTGVKFDVDKWYHVAVTYSTENTTAQVYVNGVLVAENTSFATKAAGLTEGSYAQWYMNRQVLIGTSYDANRWFDGQLCEFRIWDVVRTKDEIRANMNDLADATSENLKAYYKMNLDDANNGDGKTMKDYSPAAKDVTANKEVIWQQGREDVVADPDVEPEPNYVDLSAEKANCYVIKAAGAYKFPAVKGEGNDSVGAVDGAELLWETYNNAEEVTPNSVIAKVGYKDGFITFETPANLKPGNALIAAKAGETILWSWHIWIPATAIESSTYGYIFNHELMDRNLGALVAATPSNVPVESFGLQYEWGRKDPFPGARSITDNHFAKVSGKEMSIGYEMTLEQAIANPTTYAVYTEADSWGNWMSPENDANLWKDSEKTMYDPCPAGYRVPMRNTDMPLHSSDLSKVKGWSDNAASGDNAPYFTLGEPATVFPYGGLTCENGQFIDHLGARSFIWTAHAVYFMDVRLNDAHKLNSTVTGRGCTVRCVKIEEVEVPAPELVGASNVVLDGNFDDWAEASTLPGKSSVAEWKFGSDANNVYFYFKVSKSDIKDNAGSYDWKRYFYIALDTDNNESTGITYSEAGMSLPGCDAVAAVYPFRGTVPEGQTCPAGATVVNGSDANGFIKCPADGDASEAKVSAFGYIESEGNYAYLEVGIPRSAIGSPVAGKVKAQFSYSWNVGSAQVISIK